MHKEKLLSLADFIIESIKIINEMDKLLIKSEAIMKSLETEGQTGE